MVRPGRRRWRSAYCWLRWPFAPAASWAARDGRPNMRGAPFILVLIAVAAVIFAFGRWLDNSYAFFVGYVVVQYIVLGTAWNILGGYTGAVNFCMTAFFA